jgi:cell division septal protein FtsQ
LALCAALAWGGYFGYRLLCAAEYFRLRTVRIVGSEVLTEPDIRYLLGLSEDITLLQLDLPRLGARLLTSNPFVKAVALRREFPNTLTVTVEEGVPSVVAFSAGEGVLLDIEGVALRYFDPERDEGLPRLMLREPRALAPGMHLQHAEVQRALEIVHAYHASPMAGTMRLVALSVEASGASVWDVAPYSFQIRVGEGEIEPQLERLPLVIRYITQRGLSVRRLDVSYRRRIIAIPTAS